MPQQHNDSISTLSLTLAVLTTLLIRLVCPAFSGAELDLVSLAYLVISVASQE